MQNLVLNLLLKNNTMKTTEDIIYIITTFINGNRKHAAELMKWLKDWGQENELLDELCNYQTELQIEILSFYYKK